MCQIAREERNRLSAKAEELSSLKLSKGGNTAVKQRSNESDAVLQHQLDEARALLANSIATVSALQEQLTILRRCESPPMCPFADHSSVLQHMDYGWSEGKGIDRL